MELTQNCSSHTIYAVQGDSYSRKLEVTLNENGEAWIIPKDCMVLIRYHKEDGKGGEYDTLPDESSAWNAEENILTLTLAPQVLTTPGIVILSVTLMQEHIQISTFSISICVEEAVHTTGEESEEYFHVPGFLPAPTDASVGQFLQVSAVDNAGHVTGIKATTLTPVTSIMIEPDENDIPKVFFGNTLPQTKTDTVMTFRYVSKTEDISGYCVTKAQGNHAMYYPKKNQTVKLYKDADCTEKLKVDFKGWGKQNKFCFKANWVDLSHARNIVSARLWGDVVKARANYSTIPELLRTSPNHGAVDGFPVKVYANGIYQGRYTLNIPKDEWMANMDKDMDCHCILCSENYGSGCFRAEANIDGSDWTDEIHDTAPDSIKNRWNQVIRFVMNSTDEEFVSDIGNYFDVDSLIDYYLFGLVSCGLDGFGKNQLYMTYDGQKWYAQMYDMDATWGNYYNGQTFVSAELPRNQYLDFVDNNGNLLYVRLEKLFADAIKERWEELKNSALSIDNIVNRFERFADIVPPYLVEEDYAETTADGSFTAIPGQATNNIQQIRTYAVNRKAYCDKYIALLGTTDEGDESVLYALTQETTFDGANYIDTGVKLFDTAKDFSIVIDCSMPAQADTGVRVYSATNNNGGNGVMFAYNGPYQKYVVAPGTNPNGVAVVNIPDGVRSKVVVTAIGGIVNSVTYRQETGNIVRPEVFPPQSYVAHDAPLIIGGGYHYGTIMRFWSGTVYDLKVYDRVLSDSEITAYLA